MKKIIIFTISFFLLAACDEEPPVITPPPEPPPDTVMACVVDEFIISQDTGFYVFHPGQMEYGYAEAIKLNKAWKASVFAIYSPDPLVDAAINIKTYYDSAGFGGSEVISMGILKLEPGCFQVVDGENCDFNDPMVDFVCGRYLSIDVDYTLDRYLVDETATEDNLFEITAYDSLTHMLEGKFSISFVVDTTRGEPFPFNPYHVRFFNGSFETVVRQ